MIDFWILGRPAKWRHACCAVGISALLLGMHPSFVLASGGSGGTFNGGAGGVHDTDGASGNGGGGGSGGLAGTSGVPDGEIGMDSSDTASGGGGGGGGYTANDASGTATTDNIGTLTGGNGGAGGASMAGVGNGAGGGGGEGGLGAIVTGSGMTSTNGNPMSPFAPAFIIGGNGGAGGASNTTNAQTGSGGGDGGIGVRFTDVNVTFINYSGGVVAAGNGGIGGSISSSTNPNSLGGVGGYGGIAVQFDGANATLINDGSITGGSGAAGTAASNTGGDGGIGADGAKFDGSGAVVVNTGSITGGNGASGGSGLDGGIGGNGGNGVEITNSGSLIQNSGTITGGNAGAGGSGTSTDGSDGSPGIGVSTNANATIINSGAIVGGINPLTMERAPAVRMSSGTNVLEIQAGYSFIGNVIGLGTDTLRFGGSNDAAFNLSDIGLAAKYQQFEFLAKNGSSAWTLTGTTSFSGPTTVSAGSLFVNGSLGSSAIAVNGGVLGGNGTVGAITVNNGAIVDPGAAANAVGTLTSTGAFSAMTGSTLHIDVNRSANDQLIANSAALNGNGTVVVHRLSGLLTVNQHYVFLTTSAGAPLGGANVFAGITDDLPRIDLLLGYTANSVYFYFVGSGVNFATVAQTPNELAVANYLDQTVASSSGDYRTVLEQLDQLNADQLRAAYNQLSGEAHATAGQTTINTTTLMLLQVGNRLSALSMNGSAGGFGGNNLMAQISPAAYPSPSPNSNDIQLVSHAEAATAETMRAESCALCCDCCANQRLWNAWSTGYGLGGSAQSDGNASGASYGVGGFLAGVDRWIDESTLVGVFGGYLGSGFSTGVPSANVHDNAGQGGLYALRRGDVLYVSGLIGGQSDQYTSRRNINFGTINRTATGNYDGWQGFGYSELGANLTANQLTLQPYGALQYVHLRQNSISETGADSLNLASDGFDTDSLRSFLGARLRYDNQGQNNLRRIVPELQASWLHEYIDARSAFNARFGAVGGNGFNTQGLNVGRDWALLGAGLTYVVTDNIRLTANYYAQTNDRQTYHVGSGGLAIQW